MSQFSPDCWGQVFWETLHIISFAYPENPTASDKENMYNFFKYMGTALPCKECREHYTKNFEKLNILNSLNSRDDLTKWVYDLHNIVNKQLNKTNIPTYKEVVDKYESMRTRDTTGKPGTCSSIHGAVCSNTNGIKCVVDYIPISENFSAGSGFSSTTNEKVYLSIIFFLAMVIVIIYSRKSLSKSKRN
jgi:hypothetical protein